MEIGLVSCTKRKRNERCTPAELYMKSSFFRKARRYCELNHDDWYILSAKHHLLEPDGATIEPYDETLSGASVNKRREWAEETYNQMVEAEVVSEGTRLIIHGGKDYYSKLLPLLEENEITYKIAAEGLRYGETLSWYNEHLEG